MQFSPNPTPFANPLPPLRLGSIAYLNMQPLVDGLEALAGDGLTIVEGPPSRLAAWLERGEIDVGVVPVASIFAHPAWRVAGRSMIGARGAVRSVIMAGAGDPAQWRRLRPDSHSMTSNLLARVLLARRWGARPSLGEPLPPEGWSPPGRLEEGEGFVLIGSRALEGHERRKARGATVIDMGAAWMELTGLPFVFALWAARPGIAMDGWAQKFEARWQVNMGRLAELGRGWYRLAEEKLTPAGAERYLRENVSYEFDAEARRGLLRFYAEACAIGLIEDRWDPAAALGDGAAGDD